MPNISELRDSRYLKKEDCPLGLTIRDLVQENVGMEGHEDIKWVLYFNETPKGLVLNTTNGQIMAENFGSEEMNDWMGKRVELYNDKNVMYAGKRIGGVRVRSNPDSDTAVNKKLDEAKEENDEIPF